MNGIKHIFFDLDHTLWDFEYNSRATYQYIFNKNKMNIDVNAFKKTYNPINENYWNLYRKDQISKPDLRYGRLNDTFKAMNLDVSDEMIDVLAHEYIEHLCDFNKLFDGTFEILEYLNDKYQLHIITNGFDEVQHKKIRNSKLDSYFDQIITSEKIGVKKPNPLIFQVALRNAKAKAEESLMIGDNYEADVLGAINVGMEAIYCDFNGSPISDNITTVNELKELEKHL